MDGLEFVFVTLPPANGSDGRCTPLLNDTDLSDGRIPVVLGMGSVVWLAAFVFYLVLRWVAPDYTTIMYYGEDEERPLLRKASINDDYGIAVKKSFNWIVDLILLRLDDVKAKCGPDAYSYLNLLWHLVVLLTAFTLFSVSVILPINYNVGDQHHSDQNFARTTMTNIKPESGVLWVHTLFAIFYLILTGVFMFYYIIQLGKYQKEYSTSSIMIQELPAVLGNEDIQQHFEEAGYHTKDIQFAYDVSKLLKLYNEYTEKRTQLKLAQSVKDECNTEVTVNVGFANKIRAVCCCANSGVNARVYYGDECTRLQEELKIERVEVNQKRLPLLFVTMESQLEAAGVTDGYRLCKHKSTSSLSDALLSDSWRVSMAPFPTDILWENLSISRISWWIRWIALNFCLLAFLFFFTTPTTLLYSLDSLRVRFHDATNTSSSIYTFSPVVTTYTPILLQLLFSSLMPYLVAYSTYLESHWTKSFREQIILRKAYIYLLILLIILPSVSLTSIQALAEDSRDRTTLDEQLNCAFLPNNGGFFIGYVITAAFIGTTLEWIRIPQFVQYSYRRYFAKSSLQRAYANEVARKNFQFGSQYAYVIVIFAITITFSVTSPIIAPFGLLYFILKYYVDKYNIYYVHHPTSLRGRQTLHRNAVNFVMMGAFLLQICILCYLVLRLGDVNPKSVFMIVIFTIALLMWICSMFLDWFSYLMPTIRWRFGKEVVIFKSESERYQEFEGEALAKDAYVPSIMTEEQWKTESLSPSANENYQSLSSMKYKMSQLDEDAEL